MQNNLSLYIHYPYCVRKCPYCDFNSHAISKAYQNFDKLYLECLKKEFDSFLPYFDGRKIISVFFGGGTPSLASIELIQGILEYVKQYLAPNSEITIEANPGTVLERKLQDLYECGINRISIGVQSFSDLNLQNLGRIHNSEQAIRAILLAKKVGFKNINLDIMHGLMDQDVKGALYDLEMAVSFEPSHISWYELTIEEDTYFGSHQPILPNENQLYDIEQYGFEFLQAHKFDRYEISAFCRDQKRCIHNQNYWLFGDYIGLGAGAHSKISFLNRTYRKANFELPNVYLENFAKTNLSVVKKADLPFEYMLNRLRLFGKISFEHYIKTTALDLDTIKPKLHQAEDLGLLSLDDESYELTPKGKIMLNDILELFL